MLYAAATPLPFRAAEVRHALRMHTASAGEVLEDADVRRHTAGAAPLSERNLAPVLVMARYELPTLTH